MSAHPPTPKNGAIAFLALVVVLGLVATSLATLGAVLAPGSGNGTRNGTPVGTSVNPSPTSLAGGSTSAIVQGQTSAVTETIPSSGTAPYSWQWLFSTDGGATYTLATASECAVPQGTGAMPGAVETCSFATTGSTPTGTFLFELRVTDSASAPESVTSVASSTITVTASPLLGARSGPPALDTEPASYCRGGCTTSDWFGGAHGSGALTLTTANPDELLVLEITDAGETGSGLIAADVTDSQGSSWSLLPSHLWNGTGSEQYFLYAIDATSGSDTVKVDSAAGSLTAATNATAVLAAFTGVDTSAPIGTVGSFDSSVGTAASAVVTAGVAPTTILGVLSTNQSASSFTPTASPSFSVAGSISDGMATESYLEYYGTTSTGTYTSSPTWTGSVPWGEEAVVVQGASPLSVTVSPTSTVLDLGQTATITATATGGTGSLSYTWSFVSGSCPGFSNPATVTLAYLASTTTPGCVLTVTVVDGSGDSAQPLVPSSVVVNSALTPAGTPTPSATALDFNQGLTVTGTIPSTGTPTYSWQWLVAINGGSYTTVTHCAVGSGSAAIGGATETCNIPSNTLIAGDSYTYALRVTDSATTPETTTSGGFTVAVSSALTVPATPAVTATKLDRDQALSVTGTVPSSGTPLYTYQWQVSVDSGAYGAATQCAVNGAGGVSGGSGETCSIPANTLTAGDTYIFKLKVTDSASSPETQTSAASATVTVNSALATPAAPNPSATNPSPATQITVTATIPAGGTSTDSWQWLVSVNGGGFGDSTYCTANSGAGAHAGNTETCTILANTLAASTSYNFEIQVTDSATLPESLTSLPSTTVTTTSALSAGVPTPTSPTLDNGQSVMLTANPTGGTAPYSYQWYSGTTAALCQAGGSAIGGANSATLSITPSSTLFYCVKVTDSASASGFSVADQVTVDSALVAPGQPTVSVTVLDANQALTVTGTLPSTGTTPYLYVWLYSTGGSYAKATMCGTPSGTTSVLGATETCSIAANALAAGNTYTFELLVNDSASTPESLPSIASSPVAVSSALSVPLAPTLSATKLDWNQPLTVSGTIPSSGSPSYSWEWFVQVNGAGGYLASTLCAQNSGSGASGATVETCSIAANSLVVGDTYAFKIQVWDGASTPETLTSGASAIATVKSVLGPLSTPTVSATALDANQVLTVTDTIPTTGSATYSWQWQVSVGGASYGPTTQCNANGGAGAAAGATETCTVAVNKLTAGTAYSFELQVSDTATSPETVLSGSSPTVTVSSALSVLGVPAVSATKLDVDQTLNVTGTIPSTGTGDYAWQWLVSVSGGTYGLATECAVDSGTLADAGDVETCSVAASTLAVGSTYAFKLEITDSATTPESATTGASATVTVSSMLGAPAAPTVSATVLDADQSLTVSGSIPSSGSSTYAWQWLVSVNGGLYSNATQCEVSNGTGAIASASETCLIAGNTLTAGATYAFELEVTDGATSPESEPSLPSSVVTVDPALAVPSMPTVTATALDVDQALTVTGRIPSGGTPSDSWQWLVSVNGGGYAAATVCSVQSGSGASAGATELCVVAADTLSVGSSYSFELEVVDSAPTADSETSPASPSVVVSSALTAPGAPSVSATALDADQGLTVTGTVPLTGTSPYSWQWEVAVDGGAFASTTLCAENSGTDASAGSQVTCSVAANSLTVGDSYSFELGVTDGATTAETAVSAASPTVVVSSALTAPSAPTVSATVLDANQSLTVTSTIPSTGTAPFSWQWLVAVNGGAYASATFCAENGGTDASAGAVERCAVGAGGLTADAVYVFALKVTDSAGSFETATSAASPTVMVNSPLTAPNAPSVSATALDSDQPLAVYGTIPSTGTLGYSWQWLVAVDGGAYAAATECVVNSGTAATAGATETCSITANGLAAGHTYLFELRVTDSAGAGGESVTSSASVAVTVRSPLTAPPAPTPSATSITLVQALIVTGTVPTTGTSTYSWQWLISVNGSSFTAASQCAVNAGTGASGGATETCAIPSGRLVGGGSYAFELEVTDSAASAESATSAASSTVAVVAPTILVPPSQGPVGATYTVAGSGFSPLASVTLWFNSLPETPSSCLVGTFSGAVITTDPGGSFACTFSVPSLPAGAYSVVAEDLATSSRTSVETFLVTTPQISVSPSQGSVGSLITVSGTGFSVSTTIASLVFDSQYVSHCTSGSLTTNGTGAFSCTFAVPSGTSGTTVTVTDAGGMSSSSTFQVRSSGSTSAASSFPWIWVAVGGALLVAVLLLLLVLRRRREPSARPLPPEEPPSVPSEPALAAVPSTPAPTPSSPTTVVTPVPAVVPTPPHAVAPPPPSPRPQFTLAKPSPSDPIAAALAAVPMKGYYLPLDRVPARNPPPRPVSEPAPTPLVTAPPPVSAPPREPTAPVPPPPARITRSEVELIPPKLIAPSPEPAPATPPTAHVEPVPVAPPPARVEPTPAPAATAAPTPPTPAPATPAPAESKPPESAKPEDLDNVLSDIDSLIHQILRPPPKKPTESTSEDSKGDGGESPPEATSEGSSETRDES